ncbi:hypothetical protein SLEP1_g514 [Rubroshorea leprosula]|uniref:Reverse transcriptase Ty1/copia-type domain-containing protein n=1 Tax=Rubroshorea leprosula TaxID=152421 RepID=A0AAV5HL74_9ROSI|nr:hypothetical protein SLEP1_g514 [Rubroshorea leprosula]
MLSFGNTLCFPHYQTSRCHFDQPPLFTNPSVKLFPYDFDVDTFDELYNASPHAPPGSIEDVLPIGNALNNVESSSLTSSISPVRSNPVDIEPKNEILNPPSSHPIRETFAPVAHPTSIRSLIAIAAAKRWKLFQMDVKNAFLNDDLVEEVYMKPPSRLEHPPNKVCLLNPHDISLFIRKTNHGMVLLLLYVDDMIINRDDISGIHDLKQFLSHKFEMKDLGVLNYFLGLETTFTPLKPNVRLTSIDGYPLTDLTRYRQLVGSLIYLTTTQPNIAFAVHVVSQFMATPRSTRYAVILHIIGYIKGTMFHGLHFAAHSSLELRAYFNADWARDSNDHKSTNGYCLFLGDSLIS